MVQANDEGEIKSSLSSSLQGSKLFQFCFQIKGNICFLEQKVVFHILFQFLQHISNISCIFIKSLIIGR